jgi:hypothetical protein
LLFSIKEIPYSIKHYHKGNGVGHLINSEHAVGHGIQKKRTLFCFSDQVIPGWYDMDSGRKIDFPDKI